MTDIFRGMYMCGSIFLALALLGLILVMSMERPKRDPNAMSWSQYWDAQRKRAQLEAELEELEKESKND